MATPDDPTGTRLRKAFLEDHRHFARGVADLLQSLHDDDPTGASGLARKVDLVAGPHIEFEETALYPSLREVLGLPLVDRLYDEHDEGREAICDLVERPPDRPFEADERRRLIDQLTIAKEHITTCGTLLSHLDRLDEAHKQELLARLMEMRDKGSRWSELDVEESAGLVAT